METLTYSNESLEKLHEKIKDIKLCMLTTIEKDGSLRSRPMATIHSQPDGILWFFTKEFSTKVEEILNIDQVNLSYADMSGGVYVSVSGSATIVHDKQKMEQLWNPLLRAWFPQGIDDPDIALLRVEMAQAEYWEASSNKMVQLFGMVKAMITGKEYKQGDHEKLTF